MTVGNSSIVHETLASLDISDSSTIARLVDVLDEHSKSLAVDEQLRQEIGSDTPDIWLDLRRLWTVVANSVSTIEDEDDENEDGAAAGLRSLCVSVAKFTRNLVAAVPENQSRAYENEASIRRLLHHYTSYAQTQKPEAFIVSRILTQALSNIVTANEYLIEKLWKSYLQLPEEQLIFIRIISTPDAGTVLASFVLILNCLYGSKTRMNLLTTSLSGPRLCITYLDRMASLFENSDKESARAFDIGYRIFREWTEEGLLPAIYSRIGITDEAVTPHQTTLLKLLDAYLQPSNLGHASLCTLMTTTFFALAEYAQQSIQRALGSYKSTPDSANTSLPPAADTESSSPLNQIDLLLPKVCEALVLVTQCLVSLALFSEEECNSKGPVPSQERTPSSPKTLRLLDQFLPRITFGKVAPPPDSSLHPQAADPKGFSCLKRDLVRLLGILVADRRPVQDRIRDCGGIPVVLNQCVIDDRNPYLREHAILALRNLLYGNSENQAVVNAIQPLGNWENTIAE
ncbi:spinocerebellar ataxia type 10 protein domain-containing protein [Irpex lacteus]|nr:spinocerebellar ataxia type 10 protein domain-containing protein [Irpex lacteus]